MAVIKRVKRTGDVSYSVDYYDERGSRVRRVVGRNREEAEKYLKHCLTQVQKKALWGDHVDMKITFSELWDTFLRNYVDGRLKPNTVKTYEIVGRDLLPYFGHLQVGQIKPDDITAYVQWKRNHNHRGEAPVGNATLNLHLWVMTGMFRRGVKWGLLRRNPMDRVDKLKEYPKEMRALTRPEYRRLMERGTDLWMKDMIIVAVHTGMRKGEIQKLRWEQVCWSKQYILLRAEETKGSKARRVPINGVVVEALKRRQLATRSPFVFSNPSGLFLHAHQPAWKKACREASVEGVRFHDLRHTCGSWMAEAGVPVYNIQQVLGHAHIQTTMKYVHVTDHAKALAVGALEKLVAEE